jgi:hypothetical protein
MDGDHSEDEEVEIDRTAITIPVDPTMSLPHLMKMTEMFKHRTPKIAEELVGLVLHAKRKTYNLHHSQH